jgi:hypothetical protein
VFALPSTGPVGGIGLPVLLAVLASAGVTGALVRTWAPRGLSGLSEPAGRSREQHC